MGHQNKAELMYHGKTFLEHLADILSPSGMSMFLSAAYYKLEPPAGFRLVEDCVRDEHGEYIGPLGGILSCLIEAEKQGLDGVFFLPADAPLYDLKLTRRLTGAMQTDTFIVMPTDHIGRMHPVFGWYSVRCIPFILQLAEEHDYRIISLLEMPEVHCEYIEPERPEDDIVFTNINSAGDYEKLMNGSIPAPSFHHILLQAEPGAGKSTCIRKVLQSCGREIYGYATKAVYNKDTGLKDIYMYPASYLKEDADQEEIARQYGVYCGSAGSRILDVRKEVFDRYGTELLRKRKPDGIVVMDEIGIMEDTAEAFQQEVLRVCSEDVLLLGAIKAKRVKNAYLDRLRNHPEVTLISLTEDNRDILAEKLIPLYRRTSL